MTLIKKLLEAVRLEDDTPATAQPPQPTTKETTPPASLNIPRKKAERIAANILSYEHYKGDASGKARSMTDGEIAELIARFKADALGE